MEPNPSAPSVDEPEGPLTRPELRDPELTVARPPVDAERAERSVPPVLPAEEASVSPPPENPELLAPPAEAAPDVLAKVAPAAARVLDVELVELVDEDELLLLLTLLVVGLLLRLALDPLPALLNVPRPPRSDGAMSDAYFSADVTPVNRRVLTIDVFCAGAVRTVTAFACWAFSCRFCQVQYPAPAATASTTTQIQAFEPFRGGSGGETTCGPAPAGLGVDGWMLGTVAPDICIGVSAKPGFMSDCGDNIGRHSSPPGSGHSEQGSKG